MFVYQELTELASQNRRINVAIIGVGQMGRALVAQFSMLSPRVIVPVVICDHNVQRVVAALQSTKMEYEIVTDIKQAEQAVASGKIAICEDDEIASRLPQVELVIDATGSTAGAARIAATAIQNKKHILMMTVETEATVGVALRQMAEQNGVVYSGMAGDEPAAMLELYDFAKSMGLEVLVLGKGKNNEVDLAATAQSCTKQAAKQGSNPRMLASFKDCTKTMIELTAVANAVGFAPDCQGGHGAVADVSNILDIYKSEVDGGLLKGKNIVDYAIGVAPGVFAIVTTDNEEIRKELAYLSMGDGPNYLLYRPYHLCSLEIPRTIVGMIMHGKSSIAPRLATPTAEVMTVAKRDLKKGELLDEIGGDTVYGSMEKYAIAKSKNALPIGLVSNNRLLRDINKGEVITTDDVELDPNSLLVKLRQQQQDLWG